MKRLFSAIILLTLTLSLCTAALARTGFSEPEKKTNEGFDIKAELYEGRESQEGLSLNSFLNGEDAHPLTGRIVIATDVVYLVTVTIPKLADTTLLDKDYESARITIDSTNLDIKKIYFPEEATASKSGGQLTNIAVPNNEVTSDGTNVLFTAVEVDEDDLDEGVDEAFTIRFSSAAILDAKNSTKELKYTFAIVGQTMRTAHVTLKSTFAMGQDVREAPNSVFFIRNNNRFMARLKDGEFSVEHVTPTYKSLATTLTGFRSRIAFNVGAGGLLSNIRFVYGPRYSSAYADDGTDGNGNVDMTDPGPRTGDRADWVWEISRCATCNYAKFTPGSGVRPSAYQTTFCHCNEDVAQAQFYSNLRTTFNRLLVSVGFTYDLGNVEYGYVSASRINRLSGVTDLSRTVTSEIEACTELSEMSVVDIPQTGYFAPGGLLAALSVLGGLGILVKKRR